MENNFAISEEDGKTFYKLNNDALELKQSNYKFYASGKYEGLTNAFGKYENLTEDGASISWIFFALCSEIDELKSRIQNQEARIKKLQLGLELESEGWLSHG